MLKEKLHICVLLTQKVFDRVLRKVFEWALRKNGIPEVLVRSVMSLFQGTKTRIRVDSQLMTIFKFLVKTTINNTPVSNISILNVSVSQPTPGHISLMRLL